MKYLLLLLLGSNVYADTCTQHSEILEMMMHAHQHQLNMEELVDMIIDEENNPNYYLGHLNRIRQSTFYSDPNKKDIAILAEANKSYEDCIK